MKHKQLFQILYEDDHIIAINKPPRLASVPGKDIPRGQTVQEKMQRQFADEEFNPYILHRLDSQTSGVLLFGKYKRDRAELENILKHPETSKKYIALVIGIPHPATGVITKKLPARETKIEVDAVTKYKVTGIFGSERAPTSALIEAEIKTGRRHQILQHFASIGHPIILDGKYGDFKFNRKFRIHFRLGRQFLHSSSISFFHPFLKKTIVVEAPLPPDLQSTLKKLA